LGLYEQKCRVHLRASARDPHDCGFGTGGPSYGVLSAPGVLPPPSPRRPGGLVSGCIACTFLLSRFSHLAFLSFLSPRSHATIAMRLHSASSLPSPAFSLRPAAASLRQQGRAFRGPTAHLRCQTSGWGRQWGVFRARRRGECPCAPPRSPSLKLIAPLSRGGAPVVRPSASSLRHGAPPPIAPSCTGFEVKTLPERGGYKFPKSRPLIISFLEIH